MMHTFSARTPSEFKTGLKAEILADYAHDTAQPELIEDFQRLPNDRLRLRHTVFVGERQIGYEAVVSSDLTVKIERVVGFFDHMPKSARFAASHPMPMDMSRVWMVGLFR